MKPSWPPQDFVITSTLTFILFPILNMRKLIPILAAIALCLPVKAQTAQAQTVKAPDFAYPRTVLADAGKMYEKALKNGDATGQLEALMQMVKANLLIDSDKAQEQIELVLKASKNVKDKQILSLFQLYSARLYSNYYIRGRYKYDNREGGATPRPADYSQWNGDMFRAVIDSLGTEAWKNAGDMPLRDLTRVIEADRLTQQYFPTLRNFVYYSLDNMPGLSYNLKETLRKEYDTTLADGSAPYYYARASNMPDKNIREIAKLYTQAKDKYNALVLWQFSGLFSNFDFSSAQRDSLETTLTAAARVAKNSWAESTVGNLLKYLHRPEFVFQRRGYAVASHPTAIQLTNIANIRNLTLVCKRYATWEQACASGKKRYPSDLTKEFDFEVGGVRDTTLYINLPAGYFAIAAKGDGENLGANEAAMRIVRSVSVVPVGAGDRATTVAIVNAADGRPVKGVKVVARTKGKKKKTIFSGVTPADGIIRLKATEPYVLTLTQDGVSMDFNGDCNYYENEDKEDNTSTRVTFSTSLGVYHPGDTVQWVSVALRGRKVVPEASYNVHMYDTDGKKVASQSCLTDDFGRYSGSFAIPADGKTGSFRLCADEPKHNVYGTRYFEVSDFKPAAVRLDSLQAWPRYQGTDSLLVRGLVRDFADAPLAGSQVNVTSTLADSTFTATATAGADGRFAAYLRVPPEASYCNVRVTAPDGNVAEGYVYFNAKYSYSLNVNFVSPVSNAVNILEPVQLDAVVVNPAGDTISTALDWKLTEDKKEVAKGTIKSAKSQSIKFDRNLKPGIYNLVVSPADTTLCAPEQRMITLYNPESAVLPDENSIFWQPNDSVIGVSAPGAYIVTAYNRADNSVGMDVKHVDGGYHPLSLVTPADMAGDDNGTKFYIFAVRDGYTQEQLIQGPRKDKDLKIKFNTFRDRVTTGSKESWKVSVTDVDGKPLQAALVVNVYDDRLSRLAGVPLLNFYTYPIQRYHLSSFLTRPWYNFIFKGSLKLDKTTDVTMPKFKYSENMLGSIYVRGYGTTKYGSAVPSLKMTRSANMESAVAENVVMKESVVEDSAEMEAKLASPSSNDAGAGSADGAAVDAALDNVRLRELKTFTALWLPHLVTDAAGDKDITFAVPESNTTWRATVQAWDKNAQHGSLTKTFVSYKPLMVSLNTPRFARNGDKLVVLASVLNVSDNSLPVTVRLDSNAGKDYAVTEQRQITVDANGNTVVPITVQIPALADSITFTVRAIGGDYSDGERVAIPILPSQSRVTETQNFYMNSDELTRTVVLPEAKGKDYEAELTFTENPMWTVVDALPSLIDKDAWPTAAGQARVYFAAATALGLMKQHPELELSGRFKASELKKAMGSARRRIEALQNGDGGWLWGSWCSRSSVYETASVIELMAILHQNGYLDDKEMERMIARGLAYWDENVRDTDMFYAIVRPAFRNVMQSVNGRKVTDRTLQWIIKSWKGFDIGTKAQAASCLWYNDNRNMAKTLMGSLDQFGTQTCDKGFEFKNIRSLRAYAWLLEAYGNILPSSQRVDGLRQYLIVRKQAENWGNGIITSYVVSAMINSGTPWATPAQGVTVDVDGTAVETGAKSRTGTFTVPVRGNEVTVTKAAGADTPSYGAVITRYTGKSAEIKAYSDGEISIEKKYLLRKADGSWKDFNPARDSLTVGDCLRTRLIVVSSRPMSNVVVADSRAATLEPVSQLSGWVYGDGIMAYRENRDASTRLYLDYVPKGTYFLEYDLNVNNAGSFMTGVADVTCTQAPTLTAHSAGTVLNVAGK